MKQLIHSACYAGLMTTLTEDESPPLSLVSLLLAVLVVVVAALSAPLSDDLGHAFSSSSLAATVVTGSVDFFKRLDKSEFWCLSSSWKE